jgi:hypothetical protein
MVGGRRLAFALFGALIFGYAKLSLAMGENKRVLTQRSPRAKPQAGKNGETPCNET